ncbi:MAG: hypothetical protein HY236_06355 [Acidobacteria bacterium]|nr:hypothetical protein [Acidobacteriota bacterium]
MRIDGAHRPWMIASLVLLVAGVTIYIPYVLRSPSGPSGGSTLGITYGIIGYGLMLYAGLLGARKKVPVWRIGRAQTWMRGHLWLGLVSLPLILFHSGFAFRGPLTTVLMVLFFIVIASGVLGAALQHYLPQMMTVQAPMETIYEEIPHVREQLLGEADELAAAVCGPLGISAGQTQAVSDRITAQGAAAVATLVEVEEEARERFREIYLQKMRPFLENPGAPGAELAIPQRAEEVFQSLRVLLPVPLHPLVDNLGNIWEEERQLSRQIRLYHWLHGWLLVHVPLSIALLVLASVHAVIALRY